MQIAPTASSPAVNQPKVIASDDQRRPARTFSMTVSAMVLRAGAAARSGHVRRAYVCTWSLNCHVSPRQCIANTLPVERNDSGPANLRRHPATARATACKADHGRDGHVALRESGQVSLQVTPTATSDRVLSSDRPHKRMIAGQSLLAARDRSHVRSIQRGTTDATAHAEKRSRDPGPVTRRSIRATLSGARAPPAPNCTERVSAEAVAHLVADERRRCRGGVLWPGATTSAR